jgi:hypothetical protein
MDRGNHYELAFESYLQREKFCYIAVDETRRSSLADAPIKSLDFVVFSRNGARLVVDIKGRRFPGGTTARPKRIWECWSFREDVVGIDRWMDLAGQDYRGLLVFAYLLAKDVVLSAQTPDLFTFREQRYLFRAVDILEYRSRMKTRSPRWQTVTLSCADYRAIVRPFCEFARTSPLAEAAVQDDVPF